MFWMMKHAPCIGSSQSGPDYVAWLKPLRKLLNISALMMLNLLLISWSLAWRYSCSSRLLALALFSCLASSACCSIEFCEAKPKAAAAGNFDSSRFLYLYSLRSFSMRLKSDSSLFMKRLSRRFEPLIFGPNDCRLFWIILINVLSVLFSKRRVRKSDKNLLISMASWSSITG